MAELYEVTDVRERTRFTAGGNQVKEFEVFFRTVHGATGSVTIRAADYNAKTLKPTLEAAATELDLPFTL